jgi:hypothetical protein
MLLSVKQHTKFQGCYFHAQSKSAVLAYPSFILYPSTTNEIEVLLKSGVNTNSSSYDFDQQKAIEYNTTKASKLQHEMSMYPQSIEQYIPKSKRVHFQETVKIQKLVESAKIPVQSTKGSIGYDVYSTIPLTVQPGQICKIPTGLATSLPSGMYLRIAPRSSLALKHATVEGGVVDPDYRGKSKCFSKIIQLQ